MHTHFFNGRDCPRRRHADRSLGSDDSERADDDDYYYCYYYCCYYYYYYYYYCYYLLPLPTRRSPRKPPGGLSPQTGVAPSPWTPKSEQPLRPGIHPVSITRFPLSRFSPGAGLLRSPFVYTINAKIFQGLGPKRRESCNGDRVYFHRPTEGVRSKGLQRSNHKNKVACKSLLSHLKVTFPWNPF